MSHIPFIRPLQPSRRIDQYAMPVVPSRRTDVYPKLLELYNDPNDLCPVIDKRLPSSPSEDFIDEDGSYLLYFLGIDESQPPSLEGRVTNNAETYTAMSTNLNYKDLDASFETNKKESVYDHDDSTESSNPTLNHNTQETSLVSGPHLGYWGPQDWLMHPSLYDKYMNRYLDMPFEFEVDSATSLPSLGPSYGVVDDVTPDLAEIVKQIEYYFSLDNLINDVNFREHMVGEGWVPLPFVASLPEVRKLTINVKVILEALKTSFAIEMNGGKYIRHRHTSQRDGFHPNHIDR